MKTRLLFMSLLLALPSAAQSLVSCTSAVPASKTVRSDAKAELVGDVVVTCSGGSPTGEGTPIPSASFTLRFNANVTSRVLAPGNRVEALALLDQPAPGAQFPCSSSPCPSTGNGVGSGYYGPYDPSLELFGNPNVFDGVVGTGSLANTITFTVPFDPPGSSTRTFRFTNIRLDPSSASGPTLQLLGIAFSGPPPFTTIGKTETVATAQAGLTTTVRNAANSAAAPAGVNVTLAAVGQATATRAATLRFSPTFNGATRTRTIDASFAAFDRVSRARAVASAVSLDSPGPPVPQDFPGGFYGTESGFYNPTFPVTALGANLGQAGLADWGTRLMATFSNVPANATLYVSLRNDGAALFNAPAARLIATDANGAGAFNAVAGDGTISVLTPTGGTATAVWEVLGNSYAANNFDFGVWVSYPAGIFTAPGPITVKLGYAPRTGGIPLFFEAAAAPVLFTFTATAPPPPPPPPVISVSPAALVFTGTAGGQNPPSQSITVTGGPGAVTYSMTGGSVLPLSLQPSSGQTPGTTAVTVLTRALAAGTYRDAITVFGPASTASVAVTLVLAAGPRITSLDPASTVAGGPSFVLNVTGLNFVPGTTVNWNGSALATTFVNNGQLTARVGAALVADAGEASITALTPDGAVSNAVPFRIVPLVLSSISPSTALAGGPSFTLTATGTGFLPGATLNVGGGAAAILTQSATQITATVAASAIAQPGTLSVTVTNPGGMTSNALTLTVTEPLTLTGISPDTRTATGPAFVLTLTGTGFAAGASVQIGGSSFQPASVSRAQMTVNVPASVIAEPGSLAVRVVQGNLSSGTQTLTVRPAPRITALSPSTVTAGSPAFTLSVSGTNLTSGSTVRWNGQSLSTTFAGGGLSAQVAAALVAAPGSASVSVVTDDGVSSNSLPFTITPAASISGLSPSTANAGSPAFTLTVTGANFVQGAQVAWNGQGLPTTFGSASQLTAQVAAGLVAAVGTATVTVLSPGGAVSNGLPFAIVLPPLTNVGFTAPASAPSGQDQTVTLTLGGAYPVDLRGTLTLTFAPDSGLPDDPSIQFQTGSRTLTFTVPAGTPAQTPTVVVKTGTVAGVITITLTFATTTGQSVTAGGVAPQRITIARAAPGISSVTCLRNASGFTVTIDGFTNTREATQATFDFTAASGSSLGTTQLALQTGALFSAWFGSSAAAGVGGVFRYTQPFTVQGSATSIASLTVRLGNSAGTSPAASCQLQ